MEKTYNPSAIENAIYNRWESNGYFKPTGKGPAFCTMLPPPNVTGTLHMGHGFEHTLIDILTRYHRMMGDNTLWQCGTDHSGIATQMIVERMLEKEDSSRKAIGRDEFEKRTWQWKEESGGIITSQMRRMGTSPDWSRERFTMDEGLSESVKTAFIKLHSEGLIYRGKRLVNWDSKLHTAISDLEVLSEEENGKMWTIQYTDEIQVATTRPETILGDTAVAVHPEDERYKHLVGTVIKVPVVGREIPVVADEYVDKDFGTGCVKITPAHDFNDYEVGKRHNLPMINLFTEDGHINENGLKSYQGLERFEARKKILSELTVIEAKPHKLKIPRSERSGVIVEPRLTTQWYVDMKDMAKDALKAVHDGDIKFTPENAVNTYNEWLNNIQDWCISRQLWWGHRIPAWYDTNGNVFVGHDEADVRQKHNLGDEIELHQDEDVLDTWFSAGLWPMSTLGWPDESGDMDTYYSTDVLVTGFDLIFFWVSRMIMFGLKLTGKVPFKHVYFHGLIRDHQGKKMSKSKGNVLDPVDLMDGIELDPLLAKRTSNMMQEHYREAIIKDTKDQFPEGISASGCDALRFTFCALASTSRDINFDMSRMEGYRNFCNKLWNGSRFVQMNIEDYDPTAPRKLTPIDEWIWQKLNSTVEACHKAIAEYRFDRLATALYEFVWNEYCDWYVEFAKVVLYSDDMSEELKNGTRHTLLNVLEHSLRLLHPVIPFITEEIWQNMREKTEHGNSNLETIMKAPYPMVETGETQLLCAVEWVKELVSTVRTMRSESNITPGKRITLNVKQINAPESDWLEQFKPWVAHLLKADEIKILADDAEIEMSANGLIGNIQLFIPLAGLIDIAAEKARIQKGIDKLTKEVNALTGKLGNPGFTGKAPAAVVEKEQAKLDETKAQLDLLTQKLTELPAL